MLPEIGNFALTLALIVALIQAVFPLYGSYKNDLGLMSLARYCANLQFILVALSFLCLTIAFISNDFTVAYVAQNSRKNLPLIYRVCAVWGAHEGSLLLWALILSFWTAMVSWFSSHLPRYLLARVLSVMGFVAVGFLLFLLLTSNPFARVFLNVPLNGFDLNPLLQDPGLIIHPPMLYMGYVGFSVAFAFSISALLSGELTAQWVRWARPWTLGAWCFLTVGITLGSWWAYRVLGWGGWWFWDPVENASFMPWLVGTALLHSLIVCEKREAFKGWTVFLAITTFALSLMGTFLVRSGVLTSVHAFASDPTRGAYILVFLLLVVGLSLSLYAWRAPRLSGQINFAILSRETLILCNNVFLITAAATVLLGTLYPLVLQSLNIGKISVGAPYFNGVFIPLMVFMLTTLGLAMHCQWQQMSLLDLMKRLALIFLLTVLLSALFIFIFAPTFSLAAFIGLLLACWVLLTTLTHCWQRMSKAGGFHQLTRPFYGMVLSHVGVAIVVIGISLTSVYSHEREVRVQVGEWVDLANYQIQFLGVNHAAGPNYEKDSATLVIRKNNQTIAHLFPQKRHYESQSMIMTKPAMDVGLFRDIYVALGDEFQDGSWSLRLYVKPFIRWIWVGGLIIMLGGLLALTAHRSNNSLGNNHR